MDYLTHSYKPITNTAWVRARLCKLQKGCTRLAAASDKVYQLLAHCRWFSPGTLASSTTKTGRHDIAEILLKVVLNTPKINLWLFYFQSKTIAEQVAEKLNAKLGYKPQSEEEEQENAADMFKRYEEELEINDFPQTARWKVTSKVKKKTVHITIRSSDPNFHY